MKIISIIIIAIILSVSIALSAISDYSDSGWTASSGYNSMPGKAKNVSLIPNGYSFFCEGTTGTCYEIMGGHLWINDDPGTLGPNYIEVSIQKR